MAKDEMEIITEDRWGQEIWGVTSAKSGAPDLTIQEKRDDQISSPAKLIFYFGGEVIHSEDPTSEL